MYYNKNANFEHPILVLKILTLDSNHPIAKKKRLLSILQKEPQNYMTENLQKQLKKTQEMHKNLRTVIMINYELTET